MNKNQYPNSLFNTSAPICPPDCEFRQPKCQAYCRVYKIGKRERDKVNETVRKEKAMERIINTIPKRDRKRNG